MSVDERSRDSSGQQTVDWVAFQTIYTPPLSHRDLECLAPPAEWPAVQKPTVTGTATQRAEVQAVIWTPDTWAEKFESFERINSIRETSGNFDLCDSCKLLVPSRLHELHGSKFQFLSHIEFILSKLSSFPAHVSGVMDRSAATAEAMGTVAASRTGRPLGFMANSLHVFVFCYHLPRNIARTSSEPLQVGMHG